MATAWSDMIKRGCDIAWVLRIEGIPHVFTERQIDRVDSASAVTMPSGYTSAIPALLISDRDRVSVELDRTEGVARGDAWEVLLAWNALEDAGLLDDLFARPSAKSALAAIPDGGSDSILEYNQTTIKVADNSVFTGGQTVYLGRETITVGAINGDGISLTGCTRGVAGYAYQFDSQSFGNYRQVTNRPALWRGRFVELHAHLVSPEGRLIDSTWLTGTYHRCMWRGYLDSPPVPDQLGMRLRALPLVRLAANDVGIEATAKIVNSMPYKGDTDPVNSDLASMLIYAGGGFGERINVHLHYDNMGTAYDQTVSVLCPTTQLAAGPHPLQAWVDNVEAALIAKLVTSLSLCDHVNIDLSPKGELRIVLWAAGNHEFTSARISATPSCYWIPQVPTDAIAFPSGDWVSFLVPIVTDPPANAWLPVSPQSGSGIQDVTLPTAGLGVIEGGGAKEVIRWSEVNSDLLASHGIAMLKVVDRQVNGTPRVPFSEAANLSVLSGHIGTASQIIRTVLESSGTGQRGDYDTLGFGQGLGVPEDWISHAMVSHWQVDSQPMQAINSGRQSLAEMIGGWLALSGLCLGQAVDYLGECKLMVLNTQPVDGGPGNTITTADVLLESVGTPQVVDTPNQVKIDTSGLHEGAPIIVRDVPRIQSEGPRSWELQAPTIDVNTAIARAQSLIALGDGQAVISLTVGSWVDIQPGASVKLTIAHPAMFDWGTGSRSPTSIYARCVGWEMSLLSAKQRITLLLSGGAVENRWLCPTILVGSKSSDTVTCSTAGATSWFVVGEDVELYTPGDEATQRETLEIESLNAATNQITFTTTPSSWVGSGTVVTHPPRGDASTAQQAFMFVHADSLWGP